MIIISKITGYLLPTEKILWQGKTDPNIPRRSGTSKILILIGALILIGVIVNILLLSIPIIAFFFPLANLVISFLFALIGSGIIGLGLLDAYIISNKTKDSEYTITNQRVLIYYPNAKNKDHKIINLSKVNSLIEMKQNKSQNSGSIYIPTQSMMKINPDIWNIKDPFNILNILIETVETGKRTNWK